MERRALDTVLRGEIQMLRDDLTQHIKDEEPLLRLVDGLGPADELRARIEFVHMLMAREKRRQELHDAIVKGTLMAGILGMLGFLGHALVTYAGEIFDMLRHANKAKP